MRQCGLIFFSVIEYLKLYYFHIKLTLMEGISNFCYYGQHNFNLSELFLSLDDLKEILRINLMHLKF